MRATLSKSDVRRRWIRAQRLDTHAPFGSGPEAVKLAVEHLGYVQIDTINVIERCHHHILYNRIPEYQTSDLHIAQTIDKSVFEYWTHALAYIPTRDYRYYLRDMAEYRKDPSHYAGLATKAEVQKVLQRIKKEGAISIRDIDDDVLIEKTHEWGSKKPSKRALNHLFWSGKVVVSEREGMLKKYELTERHFTFPEKLKLPTQTEIDNYEIDRTLRSQAVVSLSSICHLCPSRKPAIKKALEKRVKTGELTEVEISGLTKPIPHWIRTEELDQPTPPATDMIHILSPFDPLIIQRKRLQMLFDYDHKFEAYLPKEKRKFGYFALPVLVGDEIVAAIDLKADRQKQKLITQKWSWIGHHQGAELRKQVENALKAFARFQLK